MLVSVFPDEEDAFWLLVQLMKKYQLEELFAPGLPGMEDRGRTWHGIGRKGKEGKEREGGRERKKGSEQKGK